MWELDTCGKREGDYKDESRNEKKEITLYRRF